jgi:alginate O-acetyltransferase complex protein AlgI
VPFSSLLFLHASLPAFVVVYWATPARARNLTAIAGSLVFYAWGAPRFLPVVVALGVIDFAISRGLGAVAPGRRRRALLAAGVTMHLGVLAYFKYANFFVGELAAVLARFGHAPIAWTAVALPIGVSFITFEEISYLTDVYRGDARPARRLSHYLLFLTLFPHSIAGPIFRWKDLEGQLAHRALDAAIVREGFERFALGLAKKVLIADSVAIIADVMFSTSAVSLGAAQAWLGALAYTIQIYFDFSGYSDMAIGLGKLLGFRFKENFDRPYTAASLTEFWARWHISLSTWLRDYLYIPLGGNRRGPRRAIVHLLVVFTLSGLWHGAAWTFVLWGALHGGAVALERLAGARRARLPRVVQHASTLLVVVVGWVLFRAGSAGQARDIVAAMFGAGGATQPPLADAVAYPRLGLAALAVGIAGCAAPAVLAAARRIHLPRLPTVVARAGYLALFAASAIHLTNMRITPLIYFKF